MGGELFGGVDGGGGAVVSLGAEVFVEGVDFQHLGVEGGLFADLQGEEVRGTLADFLVLSFFQTSFQIHVQIGLQ